MKTKWYSEIPYETEPMFTENHNDDEYVPDFHLCVTECPFGRCIGHSVDNRIKVGSIAEKQCEYLEGVDVEKNVVRCCHPDNLK